MGTVTTVKSDVSFVRLITDSRSAVNAEILETKAEGTVHGTANRGLSFDLVSSRHQGRRRRRDVRPRRQLSPGHPHRQRQRSDRQCPGPLPACHRRTEGPPFDDHHRPREHQLHAAAHRSRGAVKALLIALLFFTAALAEVTVAPLFPISAAVPDIPLVTLVVVTAYAGPYAAMLGIPFVAICLGFASDRSPGVLLIAYLPLLPLAAILEESSLPLNRFARTLITGRRHRAMASPPPRHGRGPPGSQPSRRHTHCPAPPSGPVLRHCFTDSRLPSITPYRIGRPSHGSSARRLLAYEHPGRRLQGTWRR